MHQKILILDFGSQFTQLIARRIRELQVYCEIHPYDVSEECIRTFNPQGIILSGGPNSATESTTPRAPNIVFELGIPVLGICYGMQTMATQLGGEVASSDIREFGYAEIQISQSSSPLLIGLNDPEIVHGSPPYLAVWMSHGDKVSQLPPNFVTLATNPACPIAIMGDLNRNFYGVQFHPEVTHTQQGKALLANFIFSICKCTADWSMPNYSEEIIPHIQSTVGSDEVILGLSGGVDSAVAAALIHRAIGAQLTCIFIDNGLMRHHEAKQVVATFQQHMKMKLIAIDARDQFLSALAGVHDPEQKRKIIGRVFVEIFQAEAAKVPKVRWLAQGTIYPDVIESADSKTKKAHTIKSHHNVGGLPDTLHLKLLEPLRALFKDEVRALGASLGLPQELLNRHPFPGPGLGVRILGEIRNEYIELLQKADAIFIEELRHSGWYDRVSQAFAVFLPVRSVGVMGDGRTYEYVVALRAVETDDFMTARWSELPYKLLGQISNRIINEVRGINRVAYDISGKPPATIEWE